MNNKFVKVLISGLLILLFCCCGCGKRSDESLTELVANIGENVETQPLSPSAEKRMQFLIQHYTGGVYTPSVEIVDLPPETDPSFDSEETENSSETKPVETAETTSKTTDATNNVEPTSAPEDEYHGGICKSWKEIKAATIYHMRKVEKNFDIKTSVKNKQAKRLSDFLLNYERVDTYYFSFVDGLYVGARKTNYGYKYEISIHRAKPIKTVKKRIKQAMNAAKAISQKMNLDGQSEYEKIKAINDYLCDHIVYTEDPIPEESYTVYGALCKGDCVCMGYALATKVLCDLNGVECKYIDGDCDGGGHAWNLVKVDGNWYQLDVTWNDSEPRDEFFLVTDSFMKHSRTWKYSNYPKTPDKPYKQN